MQKVVCWGTLLTHWSCWNVKPMTFILVERSWILSKASWLKNTHTLHTQKRTQNNMQQCKKRLALPNAWNDSNVNIQPAQRHSINKIITHANQNGNRNSSMEHYCKCDVQDYYWKRENHLKNVHHYAKGSQEWKCFCWTWPHWYVKHQLPHTTSNKTNERQCILKNKLWRIDR